MAIGIPPWKKIKNEINKECNGSVLLAVSGGVDSIFMLDFVSRCGIKHVGVAYFDHDLGNGDTEFVKELANNNDYPFYTAKGKNIVEAASIESEARKQRYAFLNEVADSSNYNKIITGHHLNDQVETILMRLIRGYDHSTLGMLRNYGKVYRPFLDVPKKIIVREATQRKLLWIEDESNMCNDYERNYIRNRLIPDLTIIRNVEQTIVKGLGK